MFDRLEDRISSSASGFLLDSISLEAGRSTSRYFGLSEDPLKTLIRVSTSTGLGPSL